MLNWLSPARLKTAFARVKENHGCAGADGVAIAQFESCLELRLAELRDRVETRSYWAWPLRKIEIEKRPASDERRILLVPSVADRVLQTAVASHLEPILEPEFDDCSFGYRRGRSVRMAVERVHALCSQGYRWVFDADIDDFFGSVDRSRVLGRLSTLVHDETLLALVRLWLDYAVWDGLHVDRPALGLALGCVLSPMLANLWLDVMDDRLLAADIKLVRYADDFVILCRSRQAAARARELTETALTDLGLRLDGAKTRLVRSSDGFKFLGVILLKDCCFSPGGPAASVCESFPSLPNSRPRFSPTPNIASCGAI